MHPFVPRTNKNELTTTTAPGYSTYNHAVPQEVHSEEPSAAYLYGCHREALPGTSLVHPDSVTVGMSAMKY